MAVTSRQLNDTAIYELINSSLARTALPELFKIWEQVVKEVQTANDKVSGCRPCQKNRIKKAAERAKTGSMDRVRSFVATMPFEQQVRLKKLLKTDRLVISYKTQSHRTSTVII